jgi:hypothetical protein
LISICNSSLVNCHKLIAKTEPSVFTGVIPKESDNSKLVINDT